jgi:hypothetical protein
MKSVIYRGFQLSAEVETAPGGPHVVRLTPDTTYDN